MEFEAAQTCFLPTMCFISRQGQSRRSERSGSVPPPGVELREVEAIDGRGNYSALTQTDSNVTVN